MSKNLDVLVGPGKPQATLATSDNFSINSNGELDIDLTVLGAAVAPYVTGVVNLTGNQTIAGIKTFSSTPVLPSSGPSLVPVGVILPFAGSVAPTGFILCDGAAISRTTYAALFTAIGTTWGSGDGSTTFNVPETAEGVLVGVGTRSGGVAEHDTYTLGQFKDDQFQGWQLGGSADATGTRAYYARLTNRDQYEAGVATPNQCLMWQATDFQGGGNIAKAMNDGTNGTPRSGTTSHGKQIGVNFIIKY